MNKKKINNKTTTSKPGFEVGKKKLIEAKRVGGFLDFLPVEYLAREKMLNTITETFRSYGFDSMETPIVEFNSVLGGEKGDTGKQTFSIFSESTKKESLGLRFDHTVPFARILAANPYNSKDKTGIQLPFKRMVVGPAFRGERPQQGRYRQFYQFDIDIAGSSLMMADAEIIMLMAETMKNLGVENFVIKINNRKIFEGFGDFVASQMSKPGFVEKEIITEIIRTIDKVDKIGIKQVVAGLQNKLQDRFKLSQKNTDKIVNKVKKLLSISGDNFEKLKQCSELFNESDKAQEGVQELSDVLELLSQQGVKEKNILLDFSIARGLDYYTGTVMETNLLDLPEFGSVFSGGRYNKLVKQFTGKDLPVVGASIGVDRLFAALDKLKTLDCSQKTSADVMILRLVDNKKLGKKLRSPASQNSQEDGEYLQIAQEIRQAGINTTVCFLEDTTFKSQFSFALNSGVKYIVIVGDKEFKNKTVQIKNLQTRKQVEIRRDELKGYFEEVEKSYNEEFRNA